MLERFPPVFEGHHANKIHIQILVDILIKANVPERFSSIYLRMMSIKILTSAM